MAMVGNKEATCEKIRKAISMVMGGELNNWYNIKDRSIAKLVTGAGCYKNYSSFIINELTELDLIEFVGARRGNQQQYRLLRTEFDIDKLSSDIYDKYKKACKKYNETRRDKYNNGAKPSPRKIQPLKLGDLRFFINGNSIIEGKIIGMKYQDDTERIGYDLKYRSGEATNVSGQLLFSSVDKLVEDLKKRIVSL